MMRSASRIGSFIALGICIGMGIAFAYANLRSWDMEDATAYWNAASRLREGAALYVPVPIAADETIAYRYAPWLAWVWVPLTYLPKQIVMAVWGALLLSAAVAAILPLARLRSPAGWCLTFLLGGLMIRTATTGNIHALLIAALVHGLPRRSGPIWVGVAASIKVAPILFAAQYAGRRQWGRLLVAATTATILWIPALLYDLGDYPSGVGDSLSVLSIAGTQAWLAVVATTIGLALALARTKYAGLASCGAVLAAGPRLALYDLTYLLAWRSERLSTNRDASSTE
jgi:hypothetical protein